MGSLLEEALARRIGPQRAAAIARELGPELLSNPIIQRGADTAAEALATIANHRGPGASAREIAAEFVDGLSKQMG